MSFEQICKFGKVTDRKDSGKPHPGVSTYPNPSEVNSGIIIKKSHKLVTPWVFTEISRTDAGIIICRVVIKVCRPLNRVESMSTRKEN